MVAVKRKRAVEDEGGEGVKAAKSGQRKSNGSTRSQKPPLKDQQAFEDPDEDTLNDDEAEADDGEDESAGDDSAFDDDFTSFPDPAPAPAHPIPISSTETPSRRGPTTQELRQIRDSSALFKSNTFKLKIDAFLPTLRPPEAKKPALTAFLHALRAEILAIPAVMATHPLQAQALPLLGGTRVPYPLPRPAQDVNWKVAYAKPEDVQVIGSWATGTALCVPARSGGGRSKREWGVDLGITMPAALFERKDYLNARVFHKRAFYLAVVAAGVARAGLGVNVRFECESGDERRTTVVLRPTDGPSPPFSPSFAIHIHLLLPRGAAFPFPSAHLSPSHSSFHTSTPPSPPTPLYNSLVLSASLPLTLLLTIHQFTQDIPAYRDALALLRAWAGRRGFDRVGSGEASVLGFDGRGAWWALLLGGCVQGWDASGSGSRSAGAGKARLARGMSSYQLFRGVVDFLAVWDWARPLFMKTRASGGAHGFPVQEWKMHHECVFVDGSGAGGNVLSGVPRASLDLLRHEAAIAMKVLDDDTEDAFDALFLRDLGLPLTRFDATLRVDLSSALPIGDLRAAQLDHSSQTNALVHSIGAVVKQALSTRAQCVVVLQPPSPAWDTTADRPAPPQTIDIGIVFSPGQFARLVDHGPPAEDAEGAATFRAFWGDRSELRRFRDGSITESVVWAAASHADRANIPSRLVAYILARHFRLPDSALTLYQPALDPFLHLPGSAVQAITGAAPAEAGFGHALQAYDTLVRELKALDGLPLSLLNISPAAEGLRYASVFPPLPVDLSRAASLPDCLRHLPAHDIVLEFEASTKWPDDLAADQKIKLAFFEEMAGKLTQRLPDAHAAVVLDPPPALPIEDNCRLEIVMPSGIAFHARIYHNRERTLLERIIADRAASESERKVAAGVLQRFNERFVDRPRHHAAVAALHHKFPAYSLTLRLTKRWLAAHLLAPHVPPELVELLCASVFLCPGPYAAPATLLSGFLRTLHLLSNWKWTHAPLLVPLYTARDAEQGARVPFPRDKRDAALEAFAAARSADPGVSTRAWFVATEEDVHGFTWGRGAPSALVCRRITQLAKTCYAYVESAVESDSLQMLALFSPPYDDYDFILHLAPSVLPRYYQNVRADEDVWASRMKFRNLPNQDSSVYGPDLRPDLDPAHLFFRDLQSIYGDVCVFFYDPLGGDKIAGIWNPAVLKATPFKVLLGFSSKPEALAKTDGAVNGASNGASKQSKPMVTLNQEAILNEMAALGDGLVKSVSTR